MVAASTDFKAIAAQKRPEYVKRANGAFLRRSASIAAAAGSALALVSGSPMRATAMSKRTRGKKSAKPPQLAKPDEIAISRRFAQSFGKARLQIDHPHSYREWNIVGEC